MPLLSDGTAPRDLSPPETLRDGPALREAEGSASSCRHTRHPSFLSVEGFFRVSQEAARLGFEEGEEIDCRLRHPCLSGVACPHYSRSGQVVSGLFPPIELEPSRRHIPRRAPTFLPALSSAVRSDLPFLSPPLVGLWRPDVDTASLAREGTEASEPSFTRTIRRDQVRNQVETALIRPSSRALQSPIEGKTPTKAAGAIWKICPRGPGSTDAKGVARRHLRIVIGCARIEQEPRGGPLRRRRFQLQASSSAMRFANRVGEQVRR